MPGVRRARKEVKKSANAGVSKRKAAARSNEKNPNALLINILHELADYENNVTRQIYKSNAYRKAANSISKHNSKINSAAEARKLEGVGEIIAKKIDEILRTGKLEKLEKVCADQENKMSAWRCQLASQWEALERIVKLSSDQS